jgi:hypothetical protein
VLAYKIVAMASFLDLLVPILSGLPAPEDIVVAGIVNVEGAIEIELLITTDKKLF